MSDDNNNDKKSNELKLLQNFTNDANVKILLESLAEGVIIIDKEGRIVFVNQRTCDIFGYTKEDVNNCSLELLIPEVSKSNHQQYVKQYFENPKIRPMGLNLELYGVNKKGIIIPLEISLSSLESNSGSYGLAFITDITKRKKAQDELKERNEELDAYAHSVAHDLNSSINNVIGSGSLLLGGYDLTHDEQDEIVKNIIQSGKKMNSIINELLLFASIRKDDIDLEPLNMTEILNEALERLKSIVEDRGAKINIVSDFHIALGYSPWIEEIWYNLILNAIKYGGNPPIINIGSTLNGEFVDFWISDNGKGLTDEEQKIIIEHPEKVKHPNIKGHGFGISISRRIVNKLDGLLSVKSELHKGTTFYFSLKNCE